MDTTGIEFRFEGYSQSNMGNPHIELSLTNDDLLHDELLKELNSKINNELELVKTFDTAELMTDSPWVENRVREAKSKKKVIQGSMPHLLVDQKRENILQNRIVRKEQEIDGHNKKLEILGKRMIELTQKLERIDGNERLALEIKQKIKQLQDEITNSKE